MYWQDLHSASPLPITANRSASSGLSRDSTPVLFGAAVSSCAARARRREGGAPGGESSFAWLQTRDAAPLEPHPRRAPPAERAQARAPDAHGAWRQARSTAAARLRAAKGGRAAVRQLRGRRRRTASSRPCVRARAQRRQQEKYALKQTSNAPHVRTRARAPPTHAVSRSNTHQRSPCVAGLQNGGRGGRRSEDLRGGG